MELFGNVAPITLLVKSVLDVMKHDQMNKFIDERQTIKKKIYIYLKMNSDNDTLTVTGKNIDQFSQKELMTCIGPRRTIVSFVAHYID